jgi:hypothetical protein
MKEFVKTGRYDFVYDIEANDYEEERDYLNALKRDGKIQQTNYLVSPKKIIPSLHRRVHFKGAQAISLNIGAMKIKTKDYN